MLQLLELLDTAIAARSVTLATHRNACRLIPLLSLQSLGLIPPAIAWVDTAAVSLIKVMLSFWVDTAKWQLLGDRWPSPPQEQLAERGKCSGNQSLICEIDLNPPNVLQERRNRQPGAGGNPWKPT
jgi:hypothetical protein